MKYIFFALKCFLILIAFSLPLLAQKPNEEDFLLTFELSEIIVTASRGGNDLLQLPMAAAILTSKDLAAGKKIGLEEALSTIPGVLVQSRTGGIDVRLTIRGFGARGNGDRSNAGTIRSIKLLIDGVPETEPDGRTSLDLVDPSSVRRIEIIRTNASTLFGNASGGIINLETTGPFEQPYLTFQNIFGSNNFRKYSASGGTTLGRGRFSATLSTFETDGWRGNSQAKATQLHSSFINAFDTSTTLKLYLSSSNNTFYIPGPLTFDQFKTDPVQANAVYATRKERRENRITRFALHFEKSLSAEHFFHALLYTTPKELTRSERNEYRNFLRVHKGGGLTYTWRPSNSFIQRINTGVDATLQDGDILFYTLENGNRGSQLKTNKREGAGTLGAFVHAEFAFMDELSFALGGRLDRQLYSSEEFPVGTTPGKPLEELKLNHFTPKISLLYRPSPLNSFYGTISGGLEAPAFNEVNPDTSDTSMKHLILNPFLKPMKSTTYELGTKGFIFPKGFFGITGISYSLSTYLITIANEIVPQAGGIYYFSAGSSHRWGIEAGAQVDIKNGFSSRFALTYMNARYRSYKNELGDFSNSDVAGIPSLTSTLRFRYTNQSGLYAELGMDHVGKYFADDANTIRVPTFTIWNSALGFSNVWDFLYINAAVGFSNMMNTSYIASAFINPVGGATPRYIEPGLPRNWFGSVDVRLTF